MPILPPLSRPQRRRIHKIIHATRDKGHARRLMAILLLHEGRTLTDVHYLFCQIYADCLSLHGGPLSHLWERIFAILALQMPFWVGVTILLTTPPHLLLYYPR